MHSHCSSAVRVVNSVMKDAHKEKDTHAAYNATVCTHLTKRGPARVLFRR